MGTILFATAATATAVSTWSIVSDVLLAVVPVCKAIQHYVDTKKD